MGVGKELGSSVEGISVIPKKAAMTHITKERVLDNLCGHKVALFLPHLKHGRDDVGLSLDAAHIDLCLCSDRNILACLLMRLAFSFLSLIENGFYFKFWEKYTHTRTYIYTNMNGSGYI